MFLREWQTGKAPDGIGNGKYSKHWRSRPIPAPCLSSLRLPFQTEIGPGMANGNGKCSGTGPEWVREWVQEWQMGMANGKGAAGPEWQILEALAFQTHSWPLPGVIPFAIPDGNWSGNGKREWQMEWNGCGMGPGMANGNGKRERRRTGSGMANTRSIGVPDPFLRLA